MVRALRRFVRAAAFCVVMAVALFALPGLVLFASLMTAAVN